MFAARILSPFWLRCNLLPFKCFPASIFGWSINVIFSSEHISHKIRLAFIPLLWKSSPRADESRYTYVDIVWTNKFSHVYDCMWYLCFGLIGSKVVCTTMKILGLNWQQYFSGVEVLEIVQSQSIESMVLQHRLRWSGHMTRMAEERLPKQLLYGELVKGNIQPQKP